MYYPEDKYLTEEQLSLQT